MGPPISTNPAVPLPLAPNEMLSKQAEHALKQKHKQRTRTVKKLSKAEKDEGNAATRRRRRGGKRGEIIDRTA